MKIDNSNKPCSPKFKIHNLSESAIKALKRLPIEVSVMAEGGFVDVSLEGKTIKIQRENNYNITYHGLNLIDSKKYDVSVHHFRISSRPYISISRKTDNERFFSFILYL